MSKKLKKVHFWVDSGALLWLNRGKETSLRHESSHSHFIFSWLRSAFVVLLSISARASAASHAEEFGERHAAAADGGAGEGVLSERQVIRLLQRSTRRFAPAVSSVFRDRRPWRRSLFVVRQA